MELSRELSSTIFRIKAIQKKYVRVCLWINDDCNFRKEVWTGAQEVPDENGELVLRFFGIPVFACSDNLPPKDFPFDEYDKVYIASDDSIIVQEAHILKEAYKDFISNDNE